MIRSSPSSTAAGSRKLNQQVVLDRLLDWMLVCTLREWFDPSEFRRTATTASSATERLVPARTSPAE